MIRVRNGTIIISVPLYWIEYYLLSHSPAYTTWLTVNKLEMSASSTYTAAMLLKWWQVERCFKMFFLWECVLHHMALQLHHLHVTELRSVTVK